MLLRIIHIAVALIFLSSLGMRALTIEEARQTALDRYPLVKDYSLIELTKEYTLDNASKAWLPQLGIAMRATWQTDAPAYPDVLAQILEQKRLKVKGMEKLQWKASIEANQMIWDGGRIKAAKEIAECESTEARLSNEVELYQVRQRVDDLFFSILLLNLQAQSIEGSINLLQANVDRIKSLVKNGAAMQCDADAIEAELLTALQQLISVESASKSYRDILALYIGDRAMENLQTPEALLIPTENSFTARPESQLLSARQSTIHARISQIEASVKPQLAAFAQGYYGYPGMNFMEAMMNHHPSLNALIGLSLSWNVSSLYSKRNNRQLLLTSSERIDVARDAFDFNSSVQATKERNELRRLQEISSADIEILNLRKRVRIASEARLREGIVDPLDLLKSINDEKNSAISANTHQIEYIRATYRLQHLLNK